MSDATDREEKALRQLTSRLVDKYSGSHSPELVQDLVSQVRRRFDGHAVRDFVPILIERIVNREIKHLPAHRESDAHAPESTAAHHARAAQPVPATVELPAMVTATPDDAIERTAVAPEAGRSTADELLSETPAGTTVPTGAAPEAVSMSVAAAPADADVTPAESAATAEEPAATPVAAPVIPSPTAVTPSSATRLGSDDSDAVTTVQSTPDSSTITAPQPVPTGAAARTDQRPAGGGAAGWRARPRLIAALAAAVVVVIALVVGVGFGGDDKPAAPPATAMITARGVVGSEKMAFFTDPRVVDVFARNGIRLQVDPAGSRQIATSVDLSGDDFAFPSSTLAAERIQRQRSTTTRYTPFSSPMAIASFGPIVDALTRAGVVRPGATPTFDMHRYLDLAQQGQQWDRLDGNTGYPVRKSVLLSTTDPRTSNSAAMYLAAAAYVANDDSIVQGPVAENFVLSKVSRLFTKQGYTDNSSEGPFTEYLTAGMGPTPMVWGYESQYVEAAVAGKLPANSVLLYPSPTVLSRHTLVPLNATGDRIGQLLSTDPGLQRLAAEHGFRTADPAQFAKVTAEHHIPVAKDVVDVVDTPTYETLEHLLDGVARSYN
ncbi:hypothetical protein AB0L57_11730 [Nocardia sp. NPDC052254]|uniref:three-helix bundle dimerization domain-containing protein n=1 Tax=Nocardia sp. NPDC052254 TaxID=3155681 RepID=UPI00341F3750